MASLGVKIENSIAVTSLLGEWPDLHDAEIVRLALDSDGQARIDAVTKFVHGTMGSKTVEDLRESFREISADMIELGKQLGTPADGREHLDRLPHLGRGLVLWVGHHDLLSAERPVRASQR